MSTLLVCHVPNDDHVATRVFHTLNAANIDVWVDHLHGTGGDDELDVQIQEVLRDALGGIFVLSSASISDTSCMAQLQALSNLNRRIYVLIWENIPADQMPEWLNAYPWIDLTQSLDHGLLEFLYLLKGKPTYEPSPTETKIKLHHLSGNFPYWHLDLPLIGRDSDMEVVRQSLSEGHRGTLIQGYSGIGKTRLAVEIASTLKFKDGVVWYTFTPNSTLGDLAALIIDHLNLDQRTDQAELWPLLRKYQMLLVLDAAEDCPHPREFAEALNRLILNRGTQLLITSRHLWLELRDVRIYELRTPSPTAAVDILKRMARTQTPVHSLDGAEQTLVKAAHFRPRLLWYAIQWVNFYPLNYVIELVNTLKGTDAKDAYEEMVNKTLAAAKRHDDWPQVESALKKLSIFRKGFTFDAARALLGDVHPISLLKMWGMVAFNGERYEVDPLLRLAVDVDMSSQQQHAQFYRTLAADAGEKQDFARLIAELENIDAAFNSLLERNELAGAFEIAQACVTMMGTWAKFDLRRQWLERLANCLAENTRDPLYADVQIALGVAYQERPGADRRTSLQRSVSCFERALRRYTAQRAPMHYALIQNNLGITYRILAETDHPEENLHLSIGAFNHALRFYGPRSSPVNFAIVQNNVGSAYLAMANVKDRADNLWRAVAAFRRAITPISAEQQPIRYAQVNHNLGTAYAELAELSDKKENLERSIKCLNRALMYLTPNTAPMDFARTSHNLGLAYRSYAELGQPDAYLQNAIKAFTQSLRYWTSKTSPTNCASAQMSLGQAWLEYADIEYQPSYLEKAIEAIQEALTFYSVRNFPSEYVKATVVLGIAYRRLGRKKDAEACWQKAEKYFRQIGMMDVADQLQGWLNGTDEIPSK
ncbi:MAG: TIR domain-containing protein [Anaerolineae bacterium]|nr:TIR domain-containing protein [Anaerolineae bacterium]